jgi:hypothetical protein
MFPGEFLLIETSSSWPRDLESWLEPDVARNRVWIRGGDLHIIDASDDDKDSRGGGGDLRSRKRSSRRRGVQRGPLELDRALQLLRHHRNRTPLSTTDTTGAAAIETTRTAVVVVGFGDVVELSGLVGRSELNGRRGRCLGATSNTSTTTTNTTTAAAVDSDTRLVVDLYKTDGGGGGRSSGGGGGGISSPAAAAAAAAAVQPAERVRVKVSNVIGPLTEAPHAVRTKTTAIVHAWSPSLITL